RLKALLYRWNVFLWNSSTDDLVNELKRRLNYIPVFVNRRNNHFDICELTTTTRLFLVHFAVFSSTVHRLFVSNVWSTVVTFHFKPASQAVDQDLQAKFTHTGNNGLTSFAI